MNPVPNIDGGHVPLCSQSLIEESLLRGRSSRLPNDGKHKKKGKKARADHFAAKTAVSGSGKEPSHVQNGVLYCLPQTGMAFHREYLVKRLEETRHTILGTELFKEIQSRGYQGSLRQVQSFVATIRRECPPEVCLAFHRSYLIKRMEDTRYTASGAELFKEIRKKGYQGSQRALQLLLAKIRKDKVPLQACLAFHRSYLIKRMEDTRYTASGAELFKEIRKKGYQGSQRALQLLLAKIRKDKVPSQACLAFHREYLIERLEETRHVVRGSQLFREIRDRGYRGSVNHMQRFLAAVKRDKVPPQACLAFHREYLIERLEEAQHVVSGAQLFREIRARGYRGSMSHVRHKVMMMRREISLKKVQTGGYRGVIKSVQDFLTKKEELSPSSLSFHKNYLIKRIEEAQPDYVPVSTLCEEIRTKGYQGSDSQVYRFIEATFKNRNTPKNVLKCYKNYLIEKVEANLPHRFSSSQLFKEVQTQGYQGSLRVVQEFVSAIYKMKQPQKALSKK